MWQQSLVGQSVLGRTVPPSFTHLFWLSGAFGTEKFFVRADAALPRPATNKQAINKRMSHSLKCTPHRDLHQKSCNLQRIARRSLRYSAKAFAFMGTARWHEAGAGVRRGAELDLQT